MSGSQGDRGSSAAEGGARPAKRIAVVSAGLSQPSSTRLLGDRLADAARKALEDQGFEVTIEVTELATSRRT